MGHRKNISGFAKIELFKLVLNNPTVQNCICDAGFQSVNKISPAKVQLQQLEVLIVGSILTSASGLLVHKR